MSVARIAPDLERLAQIAGIEPSYRDYFGRETVASDRAKRGLLAALGFSSDTADDIRAAIANLEDGPWLRALEPVTIVTSGAPLRVTLTLPQETRSRDIVWRIAEEDGHLHRGAVQFDAIPLSATRTIEGVRYERRLLEPGVTLPLGYHGLALEGGAETTLIVAPSRCYLPPAIERGAKVWGLAVQLYALRSRRNWGIGDFSDLRALAGVASRAGAAAVGLNPLHELDPANPAAASPYSPSSRLHVNGAYLDVEAIDDFSECAEARNATGDASFARRLTDLRAAPLVDYAAVATCKRPILEMLYASFRKRHLARDSERAHAFRAFVKEGGKTLERLAAFEALREHFVAARGFDDGWTAWPGDLCDAESDAVARFGAEQPERVEFYAYIQWCADVQLEDAARACTGMAIGLYRDLAVGADPGGAEAWSDRKVLVPGFAVGAPPDALNVLGQNWGLAPLNPIALRERAYLPFARLIRANMRHAGALRIDHAMSLQRLFWIPVGHAATEGAYVRYPLADLLAIVALESERNACVVIGEDLGTVPEGFRERLQWARVFSYRLLYFEREHDGTFTPPDDYPPLALVSPGTHDLPTLPAYWLGRDLSLRARLGLLPPSVSLADAQANRSRERFALLEALVAGADLRRDVAARLRNAGGSPERADLRALIEAAYRYLARTRSRLLVAPIEDVLGIVEQINVPGTTVEHPNWRRKLTLDVEELARDGRFASFAATLHDVRALPAPPTVPTSTYRLQLHRDFRFADAERIVPYLHDLGVSHVYASPFLAARSGSTHGYDIVDHGNLNGEIGTRADFESFVAALHRRNMGLVLDFVPNHMGVGAQNPWWQDVLEWGRSSVYAPYFDIDWHPARRQLEGKLLLPFLRAPYGDVLERGELRLEFDASGGTFSFAYFEQRFPLALRSYGDVLRFARERAAAGGSQAAALRELDGLLAAFSGNWTTRSLSARANLRERADAAKRRLAEAVRDIPVAAALAEALRSLNGGSDAAGFERLHSLVRAQHYRPAYWRVALDEINYRRFFDINDLAGLRVEYAECFAFVHRLVFRLIEDGLVQGLRIDHIDGLFDPKGYTTLLRSRAIALDHPLYLAVEKILARHEALRDDWLVAGTTGYEFANLVNALFVDAGSETRFDLMYRAFSGETASFDDILLECKRLIMTVHLASELEVLATELDRLAQSDVRSSDLTRAVLRNALADVVAAFPVYRTYVDGEGASAEDRRYIEWATAQARKRSSALDKGVFDFIASVLTTDAASGERSRYRRRDVVHFAMKFQQYTAPVMAKALEDTAFYRYPRLLSLNEVGGDPRRFGVPAAAFHRGMRERRARTPYALSSTATHDSKRGEDTRLRIDALTEVPGSARRALLRLERINRRHKRNVDGNPAPDRVDEWLLYQTLVGTWPLEPFEDAGSGPVAPLRYVERIEDFMRKALREAKRHTSWDNPNAPYEEATGAFVRGVLGEDRDSVFWLEFARLAEPAARIALVHGLAQVVLKLTAPGVPDVYQGTELWDFSLVDPDNRRPVDWALRERLGASASFAGAQSPEFCRDVLKSWCDGRVKMFVTRTLLRLRLARREMFLNDEYVPLETSGEWGDRVVAFQRGGSIVAVPRLIGPLFAATGDAPLGASWGDTAIAPTKVRTSRTYRDAFTGASLTIPPAGALAASAAFADFPVSVLVPEDE